MQARCQAARDLLCLPAGEQKGAHLYPFFSLPHL